MLTEEDRVTADTASVIDRSDRAIVLGGTDAIHTDVLADIERRGVSVRRISGTDRVATADAIADKLWGRTQGPTLLVNGWSPTGWLSGLAAAGLAADRQVPLRLARHNGDHTGCGQRDVTVVQHVTDALARLSLQTCGDRFQPNDSYRFARYRIDGGPLRWCMPMEVAVNLEGAPSGAEGALKQAIAELDAHAPVPVRFVGHSPDRASSALGNGDGDRPGGQRHADGSPKPVLVSWPTSWDEPDPSVKGRGGWDTEWHDGDFRPVTGSVQIKPGWAPDQGSMVAVLLHELGHVLGLEHPLAFDQAMSGWNTRDFTVLQPGDKFAFDEMAAWGC